MKRIIIVGILVLMVIAFCLAIVAPSVKATPNLTISTNGYYDPVSKQYYYIGEVKNVGSTPANDINIRIIAYDASNNQVDIETPTPEISVLNSGAKSPFDATCEDSAASLKIDHFIASIYSSTDSFSSLPVGIQVTAPNATLNGQSSFITGTLQNTGTSETDITNIYVTYYNSTGAVVGIATDQTDVLEPNDTSGFNMTSGNLGTYYIVPNANISGYTMTAESFVESQGIATMAESNAGTIPEFSTVEATLLLLAATSLMLIFSKKSKHSKVQFA